MGRDADRGIVVVSLFDGISCGQFALSRSGVKVNEYLASEIDPKAIAVTQRNWPDTMQMGSVVDWRDWDVNWAKVDLIIGGSPCQGFSSAGRRHGLKDPRSRLFWEYADILRAARQCNPNVNFLLENVKMSASNRKVITHALGVEPVMIDASTLSAGSRRRYYWANWKITIPEPAEGLTIGQVLPASVPDCCLSDAEVVELIKKRHGSRAYGVTVSETGFRPYQGDERKSGLSEVGFIARSGGKVACTTTTHSPKVLCATNGHRPLTIAELEVVHGLPVGSTAHVLLSNRDRLSCIGNGWSVQVISHIFKCMMREKDQAGD